MVILIGFESEDAEREITSLGAWLKDEPEIVHNARVAIEHAQPEPKEMGAVFETVKLALESGFSLGNLAIAIASWRRTRASTPPLVIQVSGRTVRIEGELTDPERITRMLESADGDAAGR